MTMNDQLLYKLAALDASMAAGFRRLDEKMDRFQSDLHDSQIAANDRINQLDKEVTEQFAFKRARIDKIETRIGDVETWQKVSMARVAVALSIILILWTVFGPAVRSAIGLPNV
jgi:hypothetical protein